MAGYAFFNTPSSIDYNSRLYHLEMEKMVVLSLNPHQFLTSRGLTIQNVMMWWKLSISCKIKVFMLLLQKKVWILTKIMLQNKGWQGSPYCHLCSPNNITEYFDHLFLLWPYISHIWFWMRKYPQFYINWQLFMDVIQFSKALPKNQLQAFLIVLSASVVCWSIWKMRKESCFSHTPLKSIRQIILMI